MKLRTPFSSFLRMDMPAVHPMKSCTILLMPTTQRNGAHIVLQMWTSGLSFSL